MQRAWVRSLMRELRSHMPPSMVKKKKKKTKKEWIYVYMGSQVALVVKHLPAMQETQEMQFQSLSWEDPLEEGMATHSSILAWRISWTEEPGGLQSMGSQRVGHD